MENKKGTTTIGMVCKDGVVVATERRATMGTTIAHKTAKKVYRINDHLAMTTAGLVGDAQMLARYLKGETDLYKLQRGSDIPVKGAATLMSNILNQRKFAPYYVQLIIGGVDKSGPHIFSLDAAGGSIEDKYTTTGSGSPYVFGVLEDNYRDNITIDEGIDLAIRALSAAMKRDSASGNGMDIVAITPKEYREITQKEIDERKNKLEIS
ncbi:MAG: archaeal proteasome endopeptidase complex subunit beta [Thermoplasmata archaeon]|nr:MAG: archaeal proteasome endopeptidase complex subunit beta [Thermoplasmata archaeon]RLF44572.1 MAG: proteasome endopeptidase complex, archaeal, beta subunit [Thermoplasmata archaeon]HDH81758.1 archaeal proteasome endopeptidase complex subunit beta [Thermoplasmatales archaeon]